MVVGALRQEAANALVGYDTPMVGWLRGMLGGGNGEPEAESAGPQKLAESEGSEMLPTGASQLQHVGSQPL